MNKDIYSCRCKSLGPGWARAIRDVPVFTDYMCQIKELASNAFILNYSNQMCILT